MKPLRPKHALSALTSWRKLREVLHPPSLLRRNLLLARPLMVAAGLLGLIGQPSFYLIWSYAYPQPYENLPVRLAGSALCLPLLARRYWPERWRWLLGVCWITAVFYNIPFLFTFFMLQTQLSPVWVYSSIAGMFLLSILVELQVALALFAAGTALAYAGHWLGHAAPVALAEFLQHLIIISFPLLFGGVVNHRLRHYRTMQSQFEKRLQNVTAQNARLVQEQNMLLSRFLSNSIVARLRQFQTQFGLDEAIHRITRQEQRFCGIMQADIRNFTKMFGQGTEIEVARLIHRCFAEISETGQDLAVIKPVGDSIFVYIDETNGRRNAVHSILSLGVFFVNSVEKVNRLMVKREDEALNFGIAIHAGEVVYGNLASDTLIDPTIIGINVNQTARLEELTKIPQIRERVGNNAIIFSEQLAFYSSDFIKPEDLIPLDLQAMGLVLRDFPEVTMVYGLPSAKVLTYLERAEQWILTQRKRLLLSTEDLEPNRYHGIPYYYELQGQGPDTNWLAMIDVSAIPSRTVHQYAMDALSDLDYEINLADGQWLIISTSPSPGAYDEVEIESRIFQIIDGLEDAARVRLS